MRGARAERSPLRPALATSAGRRGLWAASMVAALRAAGLVLLADGVAHGIVAAIDGAALDSALLLGGAGALLQALAAWAGRAVGAASSTGAKIMLRRRFAQRAFAGSGRDLPGSEGALTLAATRSLDDIDDYFTAVVPALTASAVIPLLVGARILFADWVSALIIVLTIPLVPVFMILIGRHTAERISAATAALDRFSGHLVELARGVPVLVGLGRLPAQTRALHAVSQRYRDTTMTTLRTAFLSALALELIATLSVAVVAVFIGVRLVYGTMELSAGLLALLLAPECYLPLRRLGAAFHSTENGLAAFDRVRALSETSVAPGPGAAAPGESARLDSVSVTYPGRSAPVLAEASLTLGVRGLTVLTGASGAGKSTLLGVLTGAVREETGTHMAGSASVSGPVAWAPQRPVFTAETVEQEIALRLPADVRDVSTARADAIAASLRFAALEPAVLPLPCESLSPGQQRRLALARVYASVLAGASLVLLDEPTAHLDAAAADRVRAHIRALSSRVCVLTATHDPQLAAAADARLQLEDGELRAGAGTVAGAPGVAALPVRVPVEPIRVPVEPVRVSVEAPVHALSSSPPTAPPAVPPAAARVPLRTVLFRLVRTVDPFSPRFLAAVALGAASVAAGAALTGVSAWLIVRASAQPPIMYLLVAIVGVRFFGLSRAVLAYVQRLVLHDAVLTSLTRLRVRLWRGVARRGVADRRVARGTGALGSLVADVDDVRDLVPRVVLPPLVAAAVSTAAVAVLWTAAPQAGWIALAAVAVALVPAALLTLVSDRRATAARVSARGDVLARLSGLLRAREDLLPDGAWRTPLADFVRADEAAAALERRAQRARGAGEALSIAALAGSSVLMLAVLAPLTAAGGLTAEMLAVAVLLPLALIDHLADSLAAVQQWPALRSVLEGIDDTDLESSADVDAAAETPGETVPVPVAELAVEDLALTWPGADTPVFSHLSAQIPVPGRTVVTGASGAGKTTLVCALMRFLEPSAGRVLINGADARGTEAAQLAGRIAWCPQESHVFDSTLRGNLLISRAREDAPTEEEMEAALRRVGLGPLLDDVGLDAQVGAGGSHLSGGQRQRLAVARTLLVGAQVVILDEPTAHVDEAGAHALMRDLELALEDRGVILITHDPALVRSEDRRITL